MAVNKGLHARKVNILNRGGPISVRGCNNANDDVVTTNNRKSAEVIVVTREVMKGRTIKTLLFGRKSNYS